ncbi:HET-C-related protein [Bizionia paragorgiae]|uniref:HET-C-related protein n=1 Tax=Bizionia paragorgiae TaxID=283786 RepID=UPI003A90FFA3
MSGKLIATVGDTHTCPMVTGTTAHVGGTIMTGASSVLVNNKPVARMGDKVFCTGCGMIATIIQGDANVLIEGKPIAYIGCMHSHGGVITSGQANAFISGTKTSNIVTMPIEKIDFPNITAKNMVLASLAGHGEKLKEAKDNIVKLKELAPVTQVAEDSNEIKLITTFAKDQLIYLTKNKPKPLFLGLFIKTFGMDIPLEAFEELYTDIQNNAPILEAPLKVKKEVKGGREATFYNNLQEDIHEIHIAEAAVKKAAEKENNKYRGELMTILIEEYGHYLDYLLRHHYAQTVRADAKQDEGAKFAYKLYSINPIEISKQHFATATIEGTETKLIWYFTEVHEPLQQYVNEERQKKDDNLGNYEFYKAGKLNPSHDEYGHADIEDKALKNLINKYSKSTILDPKLIAKKTQQILDKIYLGNWMRDFSQVADPMIVRPMANALQAAAEVSDDAFDKNKSLNKAIQTEIPKNALSKDIKLSDEKSTMTYPTGIKDADDSWLGIDIQISTSTKKFQPVKVSVDFIATAIEMAAAKEFINKPDAKGRPTAYKNTDDFSIILEKFRTEFKQIDIDVLGVYRPEEHIDNPLGLGHADDKGTDRKDDELHPKFLGYVANNSELHNIGVFGMKNYIRGTKKTYKTKVGGKNVVSAYEYISTKLKSAAKGGFNNTDSLVDLGAALHTLEDYFAHTNYTELSLIKSQQAAVFPWVDYIKETGFRYNYQDILNEKRIDKKYLLFPENKLKGVTNKLAACLPLVTGTFGKVDTAASVLPIVNEHLFGIEVKPWIKTKPGERTFADIMMLEMAKDFDNGTEGNNFKFANYVQTAFTFRDYLVKAKDIILHDKIEESLHFVFEYMGMLFSFMQYFTASASISSLNDAQVALNNDLDRMATGSFSIGTNPSHTQIAKDDTAQALHDLSSQLAIYAVEHIGEAIFDCWQSNKSPKEALRLLDICMQHPAVSDWQDGIVNDWAAKNKQKVCDACSPSIVVERVLHTIEHLEEGLKATEAFVNNTQIIDQLGAFYNKQTDKKVDVKGLKKNINDALENCNLLIVKTKKVKEKWDKKYPKPDNCIVLGVGETKLHHIKPNETLTSIATIYNTDVATLKALNKTVIIGEDTIQTGSYLKIPENEKTNHSNETNHHNNN